MDLWKSDGTAGGTVIVDDLLTSGSRAVGTVATLTAAGSTLYFTYNDGTDGAQIWKSDGTASGTVMATGFTGGLAGRTAALNLTAVGSKVFFTTSTTINGSRFWVTDGTAGGAPSGFRRSASPI